MLYDIDYHQFSSAATIDLLHHTGVLVTLAYAKRRETPLDDAVVAIGDP